VIHGFGGFVEMCDLHEALDDLAMAGIPLEPDGKNLG
jgi:hypothetical protein